MQEETCTTKTKKWCASFWGFNYPTLVIILTTYLLIAIITVLYFSLSQYNRSESATDWILVGGLTSTSVTFRVRGSNNRRFIVSQQYGHHGDDDYVHDSIIDFDEVEYGVKRITITGLLPNTKYKYASYLVVDHTTPQPQQQPQTLMWGMGKFRTPSPEGTRMNFTIATAGCAMTGSNLPVFTQIAYEHKPFMMLHLGDFHYENINLDAVEPRIRAVDRVLGSHSQAALFRSTVLSYMWDDHDWLGNNMGAEGVGRDAALKSYQVAFPHYDLPAAHMNNSGSSEGFDTVSPYQAYTIGTIRFILSDLRSESIRGKSIYSKEQKQWLFDELPNSTAYDFVIWVTTKPWIGVEDLEEDSWYSFPQDRMELSSHIAQTVGLQQAGKGNLLVVSSDAHMVAFDDGRNTYYGPTTTSGEDDIVGGFPIVQSGPLSKVGSVKGGPFSDGCHTILQEVNQQFSTIEFQMPSSSSSDGEEPPPPPCIIIKSFRVTGTTSNEELLSKRLCGNIMNTKSEEQQPEPVGSCTAPNFSTESTVVLTLSVVFAVAFIMASCFYFPCQWEATKLSILLVFFYALTLLIGSIISFPLTKSVYVFDEFLVLTFMTASSCSFLMFWIRERNTRSPSAAPCERGEG